MQNVVRREWWSTFQTVSNKEDPWQDLQLSTVAVPGADDLEHANVWGAWGAVGRNKPSYKAWGFLGSWSEQCWKWSTARSLHSCTRQFAKHSNLHAERKALAAEIEFLKAPGKTFKEKPGWMGKQMTSVLSLTGHGQKPMRNQWRGEEERNHEAMENSLQFK